MYISAYFTQRNHTASVLWCRSNHCLHFTEGETEAQCANLHPISSPYFMRLTGPKNKASGVQSPRAVLFSSWQGGRREYDTLVWAFWRRILDSFGCKIRTRYSYSSILLLHGVQPTLTLLSSWISQSLEKVASCCPCEQFENWKRLENILLFSWVSGKMASWKLTPWGKRL